MDKPGYLSLQCYLLAFMIATYEKMSTAKKITVTAFQRGVKFLVITISIKSFWKKPTIMN